VAREVARISPARTDEAAVVVLVSWWILIFLPLHYVVIVQFTNSNSPGRQVLLIHGFNGAPPGAPRF
jgi:hypothetical protein